MKGIKESQINVTRGIIIYNIQDVICAIVLFLACIFYRPMIFGNDFSAIGMILFFIAILITLCRQHGRIRFGKKEHTRTFLCADSLFIYCFLQCIILQSDKMIAGIQTCILLIVSVMAFYICFTNKKVEALFVKIVICSCAFFATSYVITISLMLVVGWDRIAISTIEYGYYINTTIYFPFTTTYGVMPLNGVLFRRLLGFARESGLMQIFYVWAFFSADKYFKKYRLVQAIMAVGILACFSTSGFIVFAVSLVLFFDIRSIIKKGGLWKIVIGVFLLGGLIYLLFYGQGTSIATRAAKTIDDRSAGISLGLSTFFQKPFFGGGFYSTLGNENIQTGVCALASLGQVGLVGIGLWLYIFWASYIDCPSKKRFIYTNAALFITAVFAQPIMFAPVMYWFLFVNYNEQKVILKRRKRQRDENSSNYAN